MLSPHPGAFGAMVDYRQVLGRNVSARRKALGLSQEQLGFETGIDRTYISGIERGVRNPSLLMIAKIAAKLGKTPAELLVSN
jgi:transcriptional regulator with XRE-family HTH domain